VIWQNMRTAPLTGETVIVRVFGTTEVKARYDSTRRGWELVDGRRFPVHPEMWHPTLLGTLRRFFGRLV